MTMPISNANASYINSLLTTAQNNIKTEKELQAKLAQAPAPSVSKPSTKADNNNGFYKGMAALAVGGTLLLQGISLAYRPDKAQGADIAKMSEALDKVIQDLGNLQKVIADVTDNQAKLQDKVSSIDLSEVLRQLQELSKAVKEGKINQSEFMAKIQKLIADNNPTLAQSLEAIVKKHTQDITQQLKPLKGMAESLTEIKKHLSTPKADISKEIAEIKTMLSKLESPKELLGKIEELSALLKKQPTSGAGAKELLGFGAKIQEAESLRKILSELSDIKTMLSSSIDSKAGKEDIAEIKKLLEKLSALDEVSTRLGNIEITSGTILQKLSTLGEDITAKINSQKQEIGEVKSAITRMLNGAIAAPSNTAQAANVADSAMDIDVDLIAKIICAQIYDNSRIDKIQIDYQELVELLKDKTYGQNFEFIAAKFDELVQGIQQLNSRNPQQKIAEAYAKLQETLTQAKKEKSLTTERILKSFFTPIEQIQFARGEARHKITGEKFSGTIICYEKAREFEDELPTPTGNRFLMTYADGRLVRSTKYDVKGEELFKKVYSYDVVPLDDSTEYHTKIKQMRRNSSGKREMSVFQSINTRSDSDGSLIRRRFNKMLIDSKARKANEVTRYNEEFGAKTLYRETPSGNHVTIIGKDKKVHTIEHAAPFEKLNKNVNGLATSYIKVLSESELSQHDKPGFLSALFGKKGNN